MPCQESKVKILDQVFEPMRLQHGPVRTERTYIDWIRRNITFHRTKSRDDMAEVERKGSLMSQENLF